MSSLYTFFRISKPRAEKVPAAEVEGTYRRLRSRTFWGVTVAYTLYYVCRMTLGVVKQPLIDGGVLTAGQLGIIGSAFYFVYALGKFLNGFIADYCNIRRFMAVGVGISALVNLLLGMTGLWSWPAGLMMAAFSILWGMNGWVQSMGSPPGTISLSRWFPLKSRGTMYSIFSSTPQLGKSVSMIMTGFIVAAAGWQWGFLAAAVAGVIGLVVALAFISDTPESEGLPSVEELSGEPVQEKKPTSELQKWVFKHPGIWVIAISTAFLYITQHAVSDWGVLFLQKQKDFNLERATQVIGLAEVFGVAGNLAAGWLSDVLFRGNRVRPVVIAGIMAVLSLAGFLFLGGGFGLNMAFVAVFSCSFSVVFCIVAGLMALDFVPRRATGAALGIVGISSYVAAGLQSVASGFLIDGFTSDGLYNFLPVSIFWIVACFLAFSLPVVGWKYLRK
ncbi:MAG: MFS transporter [Bacteroidales bacterium]|jgi:OPA family sugar phosphate sensor protein UhpC-like MFS transporter|nr:MFS transporter [Bacteroidales bacterium]